jgi:cyclase
VPGHGPVLRDDSYLKLLADMFGDISGQVDAGVAKGQTLEAVRGSVRLDTWRAKLAGPSQLRAFLFDYYVAGPGVAAAYKEASNQTGVTPSR